MITPLLAALRAHYPGCKITLLLRRPDPGVWLTQHPLVDHVIWCNPNDATKRRGLWSGARELRKHRFDVVLYCRHSSYFIYMFWLAGIPIRIARSHRLEGLLLTHDVVRRSALTDRHELLFNLDLLHPLGILTADTRMRFPVSAQDRAEAERILQEHSIQDGEVLIALNPGCGGSSRAWPAARFAQVGQQLAAYANARILVIGSVGDTEMEGEFGSHIGPACVDLTGQTTLAQLAAILQRCRLHISIDTGTSHLAAAMNTPTVTLFPFIGHWEERQRWRPWQPESQQRLLGPASRCPECAQSCRRVSDACVHSITVEQVASAARELLASPAGASHKPVRAPCVEEIAWEEIV